MARFGDEEEYARYLGQGDKAKHAADALIALTTLHDADVLVTRDGETKRNSMAHRIRRDFPALDVWGVEEFMAFVSTATGRQ